MHDHSPTINHLPGFLPCQSGLSLFPSPDQMGVISMNSLHVAKWWLTISPSTAFLIPSDSRVRSSRSSLAPIIRLGQVRSDRHSRSDASTPSSLYWHITRICEMCWNYAYFTNDSMSSTNSDGSWISLSVLHKGVNTSLHSRLTWRLSVCNFLLFFLLVCDSTWLVNARFS